MFNIMDKIEEWFREILLDLIESNLTSMFSDINDKVLIISNELGSTPSGWNADVFSFIQNINDTVVVPVAGLILTAVMCMELISIVMQKNNMQDTDTFEIFKYVIKMWIAVYFVTHAFEFAMAVFDMAQVLISNAAGVINTEAVISSDKIVAMISELEDESIGSLMGIVVETTLVKISIQVISILVLVIAYGRMLEIYVYSSVAPIPFATMGNREWSSIGKNYIKSLFALGLQGLLLMVCLGIYAILIKTVNVTNIHASIFSILGYTVLLAFMMMKSGTIAKSILNAH